MKAALVDSHRERIRRIESGEQIVVGQNRFTETEPSPLTADAEGGILVVDPAVEAEQIEAGRAGAPSATRPPSSARSQSWPRRRAARGDENLMAPTIAAARAGATTGEWAQHAARGVRQLPRADRRRRGAPRRPPTEISRSCATRSRVCRRSSAAARRSSSASPGLDGHSNGAEQIAVRARDSGMDVVYEGIRLTPAQIAASALQEGVHVVGLSILSGSHRELIPAVIGALHDAGVRGAGGRRRDHPRAGRRAAHAARAWPPSTRPRTSTSPASCATSSRCSTTAAERARRLSLERRGGRRRSRPTASA